MCTKLIHWYLQRTLFFFCAGNELFFVCLYLMDFYKRPFGLDIAPLFYFVPSFVKASPWLAYIIKETPKLSWPQIVGAITFPICAAKQIINCVQFWKAAKMLTGKDLEDRQKARAKSA